MEFTYYLHHEKGKQHLVILEKKHKQLPQNHQKKTKKNYKILVCPQIEYVSTVCDHSTKQHTTAIESKQ